MSADAMRVICDMTITGHLVDHAEARLLRLDSESHFVPALCFEVECDSSTRNRCMVQQFFPVGHDAQCAAAAKALRRGMRVSFQYPIVAAQLLVRGVSHVQVLEEAPATAAKRQAVPA
jgi:hypothetical protein